MQELRVDLGDRSYPIYIGQNLLSRVELLEPYIKGKQAMVVTNTTIAPLYLEALTSTLSTIDGLQVDHVILPDGEQHKNLNVLESIFEALLKQKHNRTTTLIALGGGVVGDMTGFAAAAYQRGVNFIQIPTTLLSQVDSSVGGKTGVNHALGKNMIGAFHQPQCVLADMDTLKSLDKRELSAGMAEVIKYGLIYDAPFLDWLEDNMSALMSLDMDALGYAVKRSCECKAKVVKEDEREGGLRAILNLGHTFGHAIETEQGYGVWLHGEAVAAGMVMAADLSQRLGWISEADVERARTILKAAKCPVDPPKSMSEEDFLKHMMVDKKVLDGSLRLVLLRSIGDAVVTKEFDHAKLQETFAAFN